MQQFFDQITTTVGVFVPNIVAAIAILIIGWLVALLISALVRGILNRTSFDNRLATWTGMSRTMTEGQLESVVSKIVFWVIMLFVLVAFFQALGLTIVTDPLNNFLSEVFRFIPNLLGAAVLLLIAWLVATGLRLLISRLLAATNLDDRLSNQVGLTDEGTRVPLSETLANVVYWFVFLLFLPLVLDALDLQGLLEPVQTMLNTLLGYLPNLLGAIIIVLVGWFVARIVRQIVTGLLAATGIDRLGERIGLTTAPGGQTLSGAIGTVVYVLVFIPAIIAGLNALEIEAVSVPAANMLNTFLNAIPLVFGAMIILGLTYFIAKLVAGLVTSVLSSVGFDRVLALIGLGSEPAGVQTTAGEPVSTRQTPSEIVGYLVIVGLMLFATIEAAELLGFEIVGTLVAEFLSFAGQVVLGVIVFGLGLYVANLVHNVVLSTAGANARLLSQLARIAVIVLATAMALRQMDIAEDIVNLAFGLLLGAIAVAIALAVGLGSRDIARREVEKLISNVRSGEGP